VVATRIGKDGKPKCGQCAAPDFPIWAAPPVTVKPREKEETMPRNRTPIDEAAFRADWLAGMSNSDLRERHARKNVYEVAAKLGLPARNAKRGRKPAALKPAGVSPRVLRRLKRGLNRTAHESVDELLDVKWQELSQFEKLRLLLERRV